MLCIKLADSNKDALSEALSWLDYCLSEAELAMNAVKEADRRYISHLIGLELSNLRKKCGQIKKGDQPC